MRAPYSVLLQAGFTMRALSPAPRWALTPPFHPYRLRRSGGLLSVALSLGSRRVDVIHRLVSMEPGLSSGRANPPAAARPSGPAHVSDTDGKHQPAIAISRPRSMARPWLESARQARGPCSDTHRGYRAHEPACSAPHHETAPANVPCAFPPSQGSHQPNEYP